MELHFCQLTLGRPNGVKLTPICMIPIWPEFEDIHMHIYIKLLEILSGTWIYKNKLEYITHSRIGSGNMQASLKSWDISKNKAYILLIFRFILFNIVFYIFLGSLRAFRYVICLYSPIESYENLWNMLKSWHNTLFAHAPTSHSKTRIHRKIWRKLNFHCL